MEDQYLPLYLGHKVVVFYENPEFAGNGDIVTLTPDLLKELLVDYPEASVKIHCRPLSSMTEEEKLELYGMGFTCNKGMQILHPAEWNAFKPTQFQWLLSKGFDIFGLKEKGLALYPEDL